MDYNPPKPNDNQHHHPPRRNLHLSINKHSHKISKPSIPTQKTPLVPPPPTQMNPSQNPNPPPVYNISKSDFRDMVQKLTGPPPGEIAEMPRAKHAPKPPPSSSSSRLHRIRPPPLAQLTTFASPLGNQNQNPDGQSGGLTSSGVGFIRGGGHVGQPLSPLPPFPAVHAAAESPISAYMRHLRGGDSEPRRLSGFSPRWRGSGQDELGYHPPASPLGFGCLPSPKSPNLLLPPTAGQLGFPLSPTGKP